MASATLWVTISTEVPEPVHRADHQGAKTGGGGVVQGDEGLVEDEDARRQGRARARATRRCIPRESAPG